MPKSSQREHNYNVEPGIQLQVLCTCFPQLCTWFWPLRNSILIFLYKVFASLSLSRTHIALLFCGKHLGQWYSNCDHTLVAGRTSSSLSLSVLFPSINFSCYKYLLTWFSMMTMMIEARACVCVCAASSIDIFNIFPRKRISKMIRLTVESSNNIHPCLMHCGTQLCSCLYTCHLRLHVGEIFRPHFFFVFYLLKTMKN